MNNALSEGLGLFLFVLVEQTAMEPDARILVGNRSNSDYTLQLFNQRKLVSWGEESGFQQQA